MRTDSDRNTDELIGTLRQLVSESDEFLQATVGETSVQSREARARLQRTLERCKAAVRTMEELGRAGVRSADRTIRDHPYEAIGIAFGVGILIGALVARRD